MKPLAGKNILITRGRSQARQFSVDIKREGGVAIVTPLLTFQLKDSMENEQILTRLHNYSWLFFTSSNGVKFFFDLLESKGLQLSTRTRFAVIGEKTHQALNNYGHDADFLPSRFHSSTMADQFIKSVDEPGKILIIRGNRSRDMLSYAFEKQHLFFHTLTVYDTLLVKDNQSRIDELLRQDCLDALTFTSPSTVEAFMSLVKGRESKGADIPCFCIGPTTADRAREYGFEHIFSPQHYTMDHMIEQMIAYFNEKGDR